MFFCVMCNCLFMKLVILVCGYIFCEFCLIEEFFFIGYVECSKCGKDVFKILMFFVNVLVMNCI